MTLDWLAPVLALVAPASLGTVAWMSLAARHRRPSGVIRALEFSSALGVAVALATVVFWVNRGPITGTVAGVASIRIDGLSVTMFAMVALLVVAIGRFSATYLAGDARHGLFLGRLAATGAAVEVLVLANHLLLFWLAWLLTSVCLHRLLLFFPDRPRAVLAARKKFIVARLGDAGLAAAFLLLFAAYGTANLDRIFAGDVASEQAPWLLTGASILIAVTALLKSAQFPTHGWLVEVMETPTPVSALLHAGILNAGPFLVLRFAPVMESAVAASWLLLLVGGFTAAFASVVLRTQPSVKVALGYSSAAHMGFSLFVCGLGVYPAAALHLVAHSFYKAHAFLSAGSTVDVAQATRVSVPARAWSPLAGVVGVVVAAGTYAGIAWACGVTPSDSPSLLLVGAILVIGLSQFVGAALDARHTVRLTLEVVLLAGLVTSAFFALEELARRVLLDAVPPLASPAPSVLALAGVIVAAWGFIAVVQVAGLARHSQLAHRLHVHLRHGLYASAVFDRLVTRHRPVRVSAMKPSA